MDYSGEISVAIDTKQPVVALFAPFEKGGDGNLEREMWHWNHRPVRGKGY